MHSRLTPQKAQQRISLFAEPTESLPTAAGVFTRDHPHVTSQGFAVCESCWIAQEHLGRQRRDGPTPDASSAAVLRHVRSLLLDSLI